jgi:hypothetical protein
VGKVEATPERSDFQFSVPQDFEVVVASTSLEEGLNKTWRAFQAL